MACKDISPHDASVLNAVFNPSLPFGDVVEDAEQSTQEEVISNTEAVHQARELEVRGVEAAERGDITRALELFNEAVLTAPNWASGYNNRAQVLRLKGDTEGALQDLDKALELSSGTGKAACQAYTQRGLIRRLEGDDEGALADFKAAADLGSQFAKHQLVIMNPYAAMCNQMLSEVIGKLKKGEA
ncbi:tetratricopeptide repeat protein 36-like [Lingula anatina]|uniref:Tetratricopeptide repeat protein 36-like n=1 Tax=Lingula anatina TaxID=7574 RepID=A0A1S3H8Y5_LINAN|nr:tetratricopeptide repeat protein 36-like [Lingula anatina]|eukprot:XP_013381584.1 tetratricopeptide repeat protein 36-like [Lingula anatina]